MAAEDPGRYLPVPVMRTAKEAYIGGGKNTVRTVAKA